ncbi:MAG: ABC transporter ATP-binding protein, partial [Fusobacterium periodonticum]|nr:ABC transporter ATP-binding protein [Fusobacterium periodonticum]
SLFFDNLIVLKDGKFIKKGSPYEVINEQNIKDVYNLDCKVLYNEDNKPYIIPKT